MTILTSKHSTSSAKASQLFTLFLLIFIDSLNYFLVIPVFERLFSANSIFLLNSISQAQRDLLLGFAILLSPLAFVLFSPFIGYLSDRFGRKITLFGCLSASAVGYLLPILGLTTNALWLILMGRFIAGAATGSQPVAQAAIADMTSGKQKAFYLAIIGLAMTLAMTIGPIAGSYLSDTALFRWFTISTPYWVGLILSLINLILLSVFFSETHHQKIDRVKLRLKQIFQQPILLNLLLVFFFLEIAWSLYYQVLFTYLPEVAHYSVTRVGLFTGYIGLWMSLGLTLIYKFLLHYFTLNRLAKISLIFAAGGLLGCTLITADFGQWLAIIFFAVFTGCAYASLLALISNVVSRELQGAVFGLASSLLGISWALTAFLGNLLLHYQVQLPFSIALAAIITALILASRIRNV